MSSLSEGAPDRRLVIGIDGRELQGRPTGVGRYLRNLLREWSETGQDRLIVYLNGEAPADPVLARKGIEARALGREPQRGLLFAETRLRRAALADKVNVFFAPAYSCPLTLRLPRVTAVHDMSFFALPREFSWRDRLRRQILVRASVASSRRVITISEFSRREITRFLPGAAERLVAIPLGADDDLPPAPERESARTSLGVKGPLLLSVGAVLTRRCLPTLFDAVARLRAAHPDLVLDVVGENRTHPRIDLAREVQARGLGDAVRLSGFVDEAGLAARYAAADVCVSLSEYEGFGLPALEALARGVPLLTSTRPAQSELFAEAAILADPRDAAGITAALDRLLRDPAEREALRARGLRVAAQFSWRETARQTRQCLAAAAGAA